MAQIQDRKSNFYSQKQSVRDELSAPRYLQSAGDELIKRLAQKQTNTSTSLQEQLKIVQNFEKGSELNPDSRKGITSLEDFKKHVLAEEETSNLPAKREEIRNLDELMRVTGLTRHELELNLCEKPNSTTSQLYMFALGNKNKKDEGDASESRLPNHPINHLKEIEEECFGHMKRTKCELKETTENAMDEEPKTATRRRKKHRKRKKLGPSTPVASVREKDSCVAESPEKEESPKTAPSRPSLWDVRDMKKWSESREIGCKPRSLYTIKNGKIIKLEKESSSEDTK